MSTLVTASSARLALISLTATAAVASVHHVYRVGPEVLIPAVIITVLPYLLLRRYRSSGSRLALASYAGLAGLIFIWFGFIDGFLDHVLKALGLQHPTLLPGGEATVVPTVYSLWSPRSGQPVLRRHRNSRIRLQCHRHLSLLPTTAVPSRNERSRPAKRWLRRRASDDRHDMRPSGPPK